MNINHILNLGNKVNKFSLIIDQKNVEQKKKDENSKTWMINLNVSIPDET